MSDQELKQYPRGQVSFGAGDLQQATNVRIQKSNNAKVLATLRRNPSGVVVGSKAVQVTGDTIVDEDGPERDWFKMVDEATPQQARFKFPGNVTVTVNCVAAEVTGEFPLDDAVKISFTLVGWTTKK